MSSRRNRIIGGVGRGLTGLGVLFLAFSAFQLWGTGLAEGRAQSALAVDFEELTEAYQRGVEVTPSIPETDDVGDDLDPTVTEAAAPVAEGEGEPVPVPGPQVLAPAVPAELLPEIGEALGVLRIPAIDVDKVIVRGIGRDDLRQGPGHYPDSPLPGQAGNAAIAGHRTTYGAPFGDIDLLVPGDVIEVETFQGVFEYEVIPQRHPDGGTVGHLIVSPSDTYVVEHYGDNRLTLTACHPKYSARERIIVHATLITPEAEVVIPPEPADADPEDASLLPGEELGAVDPQDQAQGARPPAVETDQSNVIAANGAGLDESLGWQMDELAKVLVWAVLGGAVLVAAIVGARRWHPRYAYLASTPFLGISMWFCFTHLDRMLPPI